MAVDAQCRHHTVIFPRAPSFQPPHVPKWTVERTTSWVRAQILQRPSACDLTDCSNLLVWFLSGGGQQPFCQPPLRILQKRIFCQRIRILFFQSQPKAHALIENRGFNSELGFGFYLYNPPQHTYSNSETFGLKEVYIVLSLCAKDLDSMVFRPSRNKKSPSFHCFFCLQILY